MQNIKHTNKIKTCECGLPYDTDTEKCIYCLHKDKQTAKIIEKMGVDN